MKMFTMLALLLFSLLNVNLAFAHGSVIFPASRAVKCSSFISPNPLNTFCQEAGWEKWGVENCSIYFDGVPAPIEGSCGSNKKEDFALLPSAWNSLGNTFLPLNNQTLNWHKTPFSSGTQTIQWYFAANHRTNWIKFYITKDGWNANAQSLTESDFDLENPLQCTARLESEGSNNSVWKTCGSKEQCGFNTNEPWPCFNGSCQKNGEAFRYWDQIQPPKNQAVDFVCNIPSRTGKHMLLSVWRVADTQMSFYSVSDLVF